VILASGAERRRLCFDGGGRSGLRRCHPDERQAHRCSENDPRDTVLHWEHHEIVTFLTSKSSSLSPICQEILSECIGPL
jgi:hypothetical protein